MKKIISIVMAAILLIGVNMWAGCASIYEMITTTDGMYEYYGIGENEKDPSWYVIVGTCSELPETLYVPAYYKGKEVRSIYHSHVTALMLTEGFGLSMEGVKVAYLPYGCEFPGDSTFYSNFERSSITFIPLTSEQNYPLSNLKSTYINDLSAQDTVYLTYEMFSYFSAYVYDHNYLEDYDGIHCVTVYDEVAIKAANTAYMFNYDDCPNNGYFFVNEFGYGEKAETTPYEPMREGYVFGGWYKEPGCITAWDFETDTLPQARYDKDGRMIYQETKLYAKWNVATSKD